MSAEIEARLKSRFVSHREGQMSDEVEKRLKSIEQFGAVGDGASAEDIGWLLATVRELSVRVGAAEHVRDEWKKLAEANLDAQQLMQERDEARRELSVAKEEVKNQNIKFLGTLPSVETIYQLGEALLERDEAKKSAEWALATKKEICRERDQAEKACAAMRAALEGVTHSIEVARDVYPTGSVASGAFEGAFFGVSKSIEAALATDSGKDFVPRAEAERWQAEADAVYNRVEAERAEAVRALERAKKAFDLLNEGTAGAQIELIEERNALRAELEKAQAEAAAMRADLEAALRQLNVDANMMIFAPSLRADAGHGWASPELVGRVIEALRSSESRVGNYEEHSTVLAELKALGAKK